MRFLDSKFYAALETISNFLLLNLLWIIFCLPIITIFPATVAMFGVVRHWILHKDYSIVSPFIRYFKENIKNSLLIGFLWTVIAGLLFVNFTIASSIGPLQYIVLPITVILGIIFLFGTIFLFSVMVHFELTIFHTIKNSIIFSFVYFPLTLLNIAILVIIFAVIIVLPAAFLFVFSVAAYVIFLLCNIAFKKMQQQSLQNAS